ncbi:unnamed protein product [Cladocopium goreaui]|uniref:Transmembrane protein 231 n=1 Tax=Cladocopium goreaui TaxID=2562237 RepID=A0A9P1FNQ5_9DINO|nr:unnamed protein product [Cladocopium goreaui]
MIDLYLSRLCGGAVVLWTLLVSLLGQHAYVERHVPNVDVAFWQDRSVDGSWWPNLTSPASYCGMSFSAAYSDGMTWGSERIECIRPENEVSTLFYATSNQVEVAFSLAEGSDPQYNTSEVYLYEAIEKSTIVFEVSFSTARETAPHVSKCQAFGPDGTPFASRYEQLVPDTDYGPGYLMLSIEDVLAAAGRNMADIGSEAAPLRVSGLEIVARVDVRNYQVPYSWPFVSWNPWQLRDASHIDCTVHFDVLRDQFKVVQWFYEGRKPIALQHGLRLAVIGTGSIGYFSFGQLATQVLLGFTAFGLAQTCLDYGWFYLHRQAATIAGRAFSRLDLERILTHDERHELAKADSAHAVQEQRAAASKKGN